MYGSTGTTYEGVQKETLSKYIEERWCVECRPNPIWISPTSFSVLYSDKKKSTYAIIVFFLEVQR